MGIKKKMTVLESVPPLPRQVRGGGYVAVGFLAYAFALRCCFYIIEMIHCVFNTYS